MEKKIKVYFAGPWFDDKSLLIHDIIKDILKNIESIDCYFPDESEQVTPEAVFNDNVEHIHKCEYLVAMADIKDVGTAWEIGMAYKLHKKIFLVGVSENSFRSKTNLMLAFCGCPITIGNLEKMLTKRPYKMVDVDRHWGNIE